MTEYILHIGLHKTGTSTIQSFLARNRDELLKRDVDFPLLGRTQSESKAHRHVAAWFRAQKKEYPPNFVEVMRAGLSKSPRCIISAEDLYFCNPEQIDKIAVAFDPATHVICYLRDPVHHVLSMYSERLKNPADTSLPQFIDSFRQALVSDSPKSYYSFERNLGYWRQFFRVTAATYRRDGLVKDFVERCAIDLPEEMLRTEPRENVSAAENVLAFQLAVGRSLTDGTISRDEWKRLKTLIRDLSRSSRLPSVQEFTNQVEVSFVDFLSAFKKANPGLAALAETSPEVVKFWDTVNLDHAALLKILKDQVIRPRTK